MALQKQKQEWPWTGGNGTTKWVELDNPCDPRIGSKGDNRATLAWKQLQAFAHRQTPNSFGQGLIVMVALVLGVYLAIAAVCGVMDVLLGEGAVNIKNRQEAWALQHTLCQNNPKMHMVLGGACAQASAEIESSLAALENHGSAYVSHMKDHMRYIIPGFQRWDDYHPLLGIVWLCFLVCATLWLFHWQQRAKVADFENNVLASEKKKKKKKWQKCHDDDNNDHENRPHGGGGHMRRRYLPQADLDRVTQPRAVRAPLESFRDDREDDGANSSADNMALMCLDAHDE